MMKKPLQDAFDGNQSATRELGKAMRLETLHAELQLQPYFKGADYHDLKSVEGRTGLRQFLAAALSYRPWWLKQLYGLRAVVARLLGLEKQPPPGDFFNVEPQTVSFRKNEWVGFFTVRNAREPDFWIAETPPDKHLKAYFGVVVEPLPDSTNRFHMFTTVYFKHWTGPVYFNLIRPFHHLVVSQMARAGVRSKF